MALKDVFLCKGREAGAKFLRRIGGAAPPNDQKRGICRTIFFVPRILVGQFLKVSFM